MAFRDGTRVLALLVALMAPGFTTEAIAADRDWRGLATAGCSALTAAVDAVPGTGPAFVASYQPAPGDNPLPQAIDHVAFVYDQALTVIALNGCNKVAQARRLSDALMIAVLDDRFYTDGRVRNAYQAGPVPNRFPPLHGWWDKQAGRWDEDRYQAGSATGNLAWAALALISSFNKVKDARYLNSAAHLMAWVRFSTLDLNTPKGFTGGTFGHEPRPELLTWKSTEHNLDAYAAFTRLGKISGDPAWIRGTAIARNFLNWAWQPAQHRFLVGTTPDGHTPNRANSGLDSQIWPLIGVIPQPKGWADALDQARADYAINGGYGFKVNPDGMWTEGTAQMALVLRAQGRDTEARSLIPLIERQRATNGLLYATDRHSIRTGLATGPHATTDDFRYYRIPHLGATAWATLASLGLNPFTGKTVQ